MVDVSMKSVGCVFLFVSHVETLPDDALSQVRVTVRVRVRVRVRIGLGYV